MQILGNISGVNILVIGDVMLDRYWWGSVERISPEAPVPVVALERTSLQAGGAANVAANVAGLGANAVLVGITGEDDEARLFDEVLENAGIGSYQLIPVKGRHTTVKTRIIAHNQQIARLDQETRKELTPNETDNILATIQPFLLKADVIVISDYAKGLITEKLTARLIADSRSLRKPVLVDPKGKDYSKYAGATLLTPNRREAAEACGFEPDKSDLVERSGEKLMSDLSLEALLITQSEAGMSLFQAGGKTEYLEATARRVYDVTGAGDTVIATMAVGLADGMSLHDAACLANLAAGLVVESVGTTPITRAMLDHEYSTNEMPLKAE